MIYLKNISMVEDHRTLPKGLSIDAESVTLLVGDQGCGKSSLLRLLSDNSKLIKVGLSDLAREKGVSTYFYDTESMNPRIQDINYFTNPNGTSRGLGVGGALQAKFMSHGEVLKEMTVSMMGKAKECVIFLDEPESGLSLKNQYALVKEINKAVKRNCQFVIATHCVPIIESFDQVYDLENKKWTKSAEYINSFKKKTRLK
jgi:predicted ATPase